MANGRVGRAAKKVAPAVGAVAGGIAGNRASRGSLIGTGIGVAAGAKAGNAVSHPNQRNAKTSIRTSSPNGVSAGNRVAKHPKKM